MNVALSDPVRPEQGACHHRHAGERHRRQADLLAAPIDAELLSDASQLVQMAAVTADGGIWHRIGSPGAWSGFGDVKGQAGNPGSFVSVAVDGLYR